jgi:hypothetical protein
VLVSKSSSAKSPSLTSGAEGGESPSKFFAPGSGGSAAEKVRLQVTGFSAALRRL